MLKSDFDPRTSKKEAPLNEINRACGLKSSHVFLSYKNWVIHSHQTIRPQSLSIHQTIGGVERSHLDERGDEISYGFNIAVASIVCD